MMSSKGNR